MDDVQDAEVVERSISPEIEEEIEEEITADHELQRLAAGEKPAD